MKNKNTKLKAMLFVAFMASMTLVGTMPMIMGYTTDGGGGSSAIAWTETQTGYMTGSIYSSGSCNFRVAPNHDGYGVYKWQYEFNKYSDFRVRDTQSVNIKMYGRSYYVNYNIALMVDYLDSGSWHTTWYRSYQLGSPTDPIEGIPIPWQTSTWSYTDTDTSALQDVSSWGYHWKIVITISVHVDAGYVSRTSSTSLNAYYNSAVTLL